MSAFQEHFGTFYTAGGRRLVITGGEPLSQLELVGGVLECAASFGRLDVCALYSNAYLLMRRGPGGQSSAAVWLKEHGLGCLNISAHHHLQDGRERVTRLTYPQPLEESLSHLREIQLPFRLNLTVQKGAIETADDLRKYIRWAYEVGAQDVYIRDIFNQDFEAKNDVGKRVQAYSKSQYCSSMLLFQALKQRGDLVEVSDRHYSARDKHEVCARDAKTGLCVTFSELTIGTESSEEVPYLVLMPDAHLYRGWLGERDRIECIPADIAYE
jgi:molybdenum cofactor biosynthesis enzyme MoaA